MNRDTEGTTYFDIYASGHDLSEPGRRAEWREYSGLFKSALPEGTDARILDFGCGAGLMLEWLAAEGYTNAEGIDSDPGQITFAQGLGADAHLVSDSISWLRGAGKFDVIFMTDVLEHIAPGADLSVLCQMHEALTSGGRLIVRVPNANASFGGRYRYIDPTHFRSYTERSLWYELRRAGFQDIHIKSGDLWFPHTIKDFVRMPVLLFFRAVRRLEAIAEFGIKTASQMPISLTLVAVARKSP